MEKGTRRRLAVIKAMENNAGEEAGSWPLRLTPAERFWINPLPLLGSCQDPELLQEAGQGHTCGRSSWAGRGRAGQGLESQLRSPRSSREEN